ncbi:diguanylate cyclase domain-containing protein [Vagococcus fluvialis]|uniref:diguanylate cyclase domain-containing protein n=1 Tax=Vagococcus fluvialis TaxID=2738 RepID=UPI001A8CFFD9|nr:diguanylate cyclase [Vagococcus fluvialis]MBO0443254.1 diguanylate cyclase [Vagococcus fluvialis]
MKKLDKHEQKIPLEVGVFLLLVLCMGQNILLNGAVSPEAFVFTNIVALMGVTLGLLGSSIVIVSLNFIVVAVGIFILFFQPVIMMLPLKFFYCFSIPIYSFIAYEISKSLLMRKGLISGREDIARYLHNTDSTTGLRSEAAFYKKYKQYTESLKVRQTDDTRKLGLVMFQIDFFEQYMYQDKEATKKILEEMAETLVYTRYPEELFFHLDKGVFIVLTVLNKETNEKKVWYKMNKITKVQMNLIPYKGSDATHDITVKMGELIIQADEELTVEQVLGRLSRRVETDLSVEYIA